MNDLIEFIFDESELEENDISPLHINNVMDLEDLEDLCSEG